MEGPNRLAQPPGGIGREPRQVNIEHLMSSPRKPIEIQMNSDEDFGFGDRKTDLDFPLDVPGPHAEFRFPAKPDPELLKHRSDFDTDSDAGFRQTSSDWDKETIIKAFYPDQPLPAIFGSIQVQLLPRTIQQRNGQPITLAEAPTLILLRIKREIKKKNKKKERE
ncbi:hypothetical protein MAR_035504 [Mya arenaria]|uniref:Uncharacterized protein n=1 Tax=Mya arenaria TaxID=6604 RepID=A0ABY7EKA9_MYAAR|nr:hypothetical protein MAR_035504 [Mya arenaria]